jgi:hypothetical protein
MNQDPDPFFALVLFVLLGGLGSAALFITRSHRQTIQFQIKLFLLAFAVRFIMAIVVYQFGLVKILGDEDASGWVAGARLQQEWMRRGIGLFDMPYMLAGAFESQHRGYPFMLGLLFYVTDSPARLPAATLNCFFGALTVIFAYRIATTLFSSWVGERVGWLACFFPSMIVWSAQTLKEPVVIFLEMVALYGCVRLKLSGFSTRYIILCALAIVLMIPFRFYVAYIAGAAVMLALTLPQFGKRRLTLGSALGVLLIVLPILVMSGVLVRHEAEFESFNLDRIQTFRRGVSYGEGSGSAVRSRYDLKTPEGLLMGTIDGGAHLLLAPFPWELGSGSLRMLLTIPELVIWYIIFFFGVLPGLWYVLRNRFNDIQPLLFFTFTLGLLYSLMFGNIGLIYRQRAQLLPWLFIFAVVGFEQRKLRRASRRVNMPAQVAIIEPAAVQTHSS